MKNKTKNYMGFHFSYSKSMANFEAFLWNISSSTTPEIVRSALSIKRHGFTIFVNQYVIRYSYINQSSKQFYFDKFCLSANSWKGKGDSTLGGFLWVETA